MKQFFLTILLLAAVVFVYKNYVVAEDLTTTFGTLKAAMIENTYRMSLGDYTGNSPENYRRAAGLPPRSGPYAAPTSTYQYPTN